MKPSEREKLRLARTSPCKRLSNQPAGNLSRAGLEIGLQGLRYASNIFQLLIGRDLLNSIITKAHIP